MRSCPQLPAKHSRGHLLQRSEGAGDCLQNTAVRYSQHHSHSWMHARYWCWHPTHTTKQTPTLAAAPRHMGSSQVTQHISGPAGQGQFGHTELSARTPAQVHDHQVSLALPQSRQLSLRLPKQATGKAFLSGMTDPEEKGSAKQNNVLLGASSPMFLLNGCKSTHFWQAQ